MKKYLLNENVSINSRCFMVLLFTVIVLSSSFSPAFAESTRDKLDRAEEYYKNENYEGSLGAFVDVQQEKPADLNLRYNIANSQYKLGNYDEAIKLFSDIIATGEDIELNEKATFNIGNSFFKQGKLKEAIEYYKKTLVIDQNDIEAKKNLEYVNILLEEMQKQEQERQDSEEQEEGEEQEKSESSEEKKEEEGEKEESKESEKGDESKDSGEESDSESAEEEEGDESSGQGDQEEESGEEEDESSDSESGEEGDEEQSAGEEEENEDKKEEEGKEQKERDGAEDGEISKEEAERLLDGITEDRKRFMKKQMNRRRGNRAVPEKDW